jgi:hypothetical protein
VKAVTGRSVAGDLAARQAALVAALVSGGQPPSGFNPSRVAAARRALLVKRAGEVAEAWPLLATSLGAAWPECFITWAESHPPRGARRDGKDFMRECCPRLFRLRSGRGRWVGSP